VIEEALLLLFLHLSISILHTNSLDHEHTLLAELSESAREMDYVLVPAVLVPGSEGGEETMAAAADVPPIAFRRQRRRIEIIEWVEPSHSDAVVVMMTRNP